jgi:hypothetical protein
MKNKILLLMLFSISSISMAQLLSGPVVPCVNCEQYTARTEPMNGLWYNPEQSGVGYSIEVQNGKVFGVYYGYDGDGKPLWQTFLGDLIASDDPEIMWTFDSGLRQFEGGTCHNCEYQAPSGEDSQSVIHIDFKHKNYASFSVNGGDAQNIVPLVYGVESSADFAEQTSYRLPDLYGMWSFVFRIDSSVYPSFPNQWGYRSLMLNIYHKSPIQDIDDDGNLEVNYAVSNYGPPPEVQVLGMITCELNEINGAQAGPSCTFRWNYGILGNFEIDNFNFPLGGLGASRLFGETIDGHTFEAIKIDSTEYLSR